MAGLAGGDPAARVLLLADDRGQRAAATAALAREGFVVDAHLIGPLAPDAPSAGAGPGRAAPPNAGLVEAVPAPDAVVLIAARSDWDAFACCRRLRESSAPGLPILLVTAASGEVDRVLAIELGADDVLGLPFGAREMGARLRARVRRRRLELAARAMVVTGVGNARLRAGDLVLDLEQRDAWLGGRRLSLRRREFDLLARLMQHRGRPVTRERLSRLWDEPPEHGSRTLDMHVRRLREKIERDASRPEYLHTVRGTGYRLNWEPGPERLHAGDPPSANPTRGGGRDAEETEHVAFRSGRHAGTSGPTGRRTG